MQFCRYGSTENNAKYFVEYTDFIEANGMTRTILSIPAEKIVIQCDVFESAIDLLSYATMQKLDRKEWRTEHLLSLAGVYQPARDRKVKFSSIDTIFDRAFGRKRNCITFG